jgi:hypothetical protein
MCEHYWDLFSSQSTSSMAGFHARTLALREMEKVWQESEADFFSKSCAWPKKQSPRSFSLKTSPQSEHVDFQQCSTNLPKQGMIVDMVFYPLTTWERRTEGNDGFCWQSPVADDCVNRASGKYNSRGEPKLSAQVKLWPTPRASDAEKNQRTLFGIQKELERKGSSQDLISAVKWTTPTADDSGHRKKPYAQGGTALSTQVGGQLNPTWVEWLMNYPTGWTELSALGTQWCPPKRKKLSKD